MSLNSKTANRGDDEDELIDRPLVLIEQTNDNDTSVRVIGDEALVDVVFLDWTSLTPEFNDDDTKHRLMGALEDIARLPFDYRNGALDQICAWIELNEPESAVLSVFEREEWARLSTAIVRVRRDLPIDPVRA